MGKDPSPAELDARILLAILRDAPADHTHILPADIQEKIERGLPPGATLQEITHGVLRELDADGKKIKRPARCAESCRKFPACAHLETNWSKRIKRRLQPNGSLFANGLVRKARGRTFRKSGGRMPQQSTYFTVFEAPSHFTIRPSFKVVLSLIKAVLGSEATYLAFRRKEYFLPATATLIEEFLRRNGLAPPTRWRVGGDHGRFLSHPAEAFASHQVDGTGVWRAGGFIVKRPNIRRVGEVRTVRASVRAECWSFSGQGSAQERVGSNGYSAKRLIGEAIGDAIFNCYYFAIQELATFPSGLRFIIGVLDKGAQIPLIDELGASSAIIPALPELDGPTEVVNRFKKLRQLAWLFWILREADFLRGKVPGPSALFSDPSFSSPSG